MSKDVNGECSAHLYIGDNYGDGTATMRCQLPENHKGKHQEEFSRGEGKLIIISWEHDERDYNIYEECKSCSGMGFFEITISTGIDYNDCKKCNGLGKMIVGREK